MELKKIHLLNNVAADLSNQDAQVGALITALTQRLAQVQAARDLVAVEIAAGTAGFEAEHLVEVDAFITKVENALEAAKPKKG